MASSRLLRAAHAHLSSRLDVVGPLGPIVLAEDELPTLHRERRLEGLGL